MDDGLRSVLEEQNRKNDAWFERIEAYHRWRRWMEMNPARRFWREKIRGEKRPPFVGTLNQLLPFTETGSPPPDVGRLGPEPGSYHHVYSTDWSKT
jgi:hypothetical protein